MISDNSTENIFRFLQLRPARPVVGDGQRDILALNDRTPLAMQLIDAEQNERKKISDMFLRKTNLPELIESEIAQQILLTTKNIRNKNGSVEELGNTVGSNRQDLEKIRDRASDILIATKFANWAPGQYYIVENLFRASSALLNPNSSIRIEKYYTRAISLPETLLFPSNTQMTQNNHAKQETNKPLPSNDPREDLSAQQIYDIITELMSLARPDTLSMPSEDQNKNVVVFSLNQKGMNLLTEQTKNILYKLGLQPDKYPLNGTISRLEAEMARVSRHLAKHISVQPVITKSSERRPYIKDVGVAELLVVKQHLKKYQRMDIAHVENVLAGELKKRTHRALERSEETFTTERETTVEKQTELETAERFELNKETSRTASRDQEFGFGLTLSGKYGPSVEFSSNLNISSTSSTEESTKSALRYSKDIIERSLERVVERVRIEQVKRLIREREETNLHQLKNEDRDHISGVYQFLEKVYESQVFDYGIRQMFDFMVPEPASYLWHLEKTHANLNLPPPPPTLESQGLTDASKITPANCFEKAAIFGATDISPPPSTFVNSFASIYSGQPAGTGPGNPEEGHPRSVVEKEMTVPAGYQPWSSKIRITALTDADLTMAVGVRDQKKIWHPTGEAGEYVEVGIGENDKMHYIGHAILDFAFDLTSSAYESTSKMGMSILAFETNNYAVAADTTFKLTVEAAQKWQSDTYTKIKNAYLESLQKYEARIAELKAEAETRARDTNTKFGAPPSQNMNILKKELRKHCISIITRQRYEDVGVVKDNDPDPPIFDFPKAARIGTKIRFFEQAFEWDQLQYVLYPYYWARSEKWTSMFQRNEVDTQFLEFLQAGSARVVVPVRPGFERAITHYLVTGEIWDGNGEPPDTTSPLYVPILTEIKERTEGPQGEIAVGDPWETHVPTPLVILRGRNEELPRWKRNDESNWDWDEVE